MATEKKKKGSSKAPEGDQDTKAAKGKPHDDETPQAAGAGTGKPKKGDAVDASVPDTSDTPNSPDNARDATATAIAASKLAKAEPSNKHHLAASAAHAAAAKVNEQAFVVTGEPLFAANSLMHKGHATTHAAMAKQFSDTNDDTADVDEGDAPPMSRMVFSEDLFTSARLDAPGSVTPDTTADVASAKAVLSTSAANTAPSADMHATAAADHLFAAHAHIDAAQASDGVMAQAHVAKAQQHMAAAKVHQAKAESDGRARFNENHDEKGEFSSGSGGQKNGGLSLDKETGATVYTPSHVADALDKTGAALTASKTAKMSGDAVDHEAAAAAHGAAAKANADAAEKVKGSTHAMDLASIRARLRARAQR